MYFDFPNTVPFLKIAEDSESAQSLRNTLAVGSGFATGGKAMGKSFLNTMGGLRSMPKGLPLIEAIKNLPMKAHLGIAGKGLLAAPVGAGVGYLTGLGIEKALKSGKVKVSAQYDAYGNPQQNSPTIPMAMGAALGGAAAHINPNAESQKLREAASKLNMNELLETGAWRQGNKATKFMAPPEIVKKFYNNKALRANSLRMLGGIGTGALTGYLLSQLLNQ